MLSIVICSRNEEMYYQLSKNINSTIGNLVYEIIRIDNSNSSYSISEAYNLGFKKSKFSILLFLHEDILFHTVEWGQILLKYFTDSSVGLIGVAGSKVKTKTPTGWWENDPNSWVMNLIQHYTNGKVEKIFRGWGSREIQEVVVIDGVFIGMRKTDKIKFDERLIGFHNYDQSISIRFRQNSLKIYVTREILIEHFSIGNKDLSWFKANKVFFNYYRDSLPQSVRNNLVTGEQKAYSYMILINKFKTTDKILALQYWFKYFPLQPKIKKSLRLFKSIFT